MTASNQHRPACRIHDRHELEEPAANRDAGDVGLLGPFDRHATAKMITSILGHTTLAEAARHTEDADQAAVADDAVIKLERHKANSIAQTSSRGLGKSGKREENQNTKEIRGAP